MHYKINNAMNNKGNKAVRQQRQPARFGLKYDFEDYLTYAWTKP